MSKYPPAFQLYPADLLTATAEWSNAEFGAYVRLLCNQWITGTVPADASACARLCYGDKSGVALALKEKFELADGRAINERLEAVREQQINYSKDQSMRAHKRWHPSGTSRSDALQSSSSIYPPPSQERARARESNKDAGSRKKKEPERLTGSLELCKTWSLQSLDQHNGKPVSGEKDLREAIRKVKSTVSLKRLVEKATGVDWDIFLSGEW